MTGRKRRTPEQIMREHGMTHEELRERKWTISRKILLGGNPLPRVAGRKIGPEDVLAEDADAS